MPEIWIPIAAIVGLILGLALGFWGGFLFASGKNRMLEAKARAEVQTEYQERLVSLEADARGAKEGQQILENQIAGMKEAFELEKRQILDRFGNEKTEMLQRFDQDRKELADQMEKRHADQCRVLEEKFASEKEMAVGFRDEQIRSLKIQISEERENFKTRFEEASRMMKTQLDNTITMLRAEFKNQTNENLKIQKEGMLSTNLESLATILTPFGEQLKGFKTEFVENKEKQKQLETSILTTIARLQDQTTQIGVEAQKLSTALTVKPKMQGNWGENILENILMASGLKKGIDYFAQARETGSEGETFIPDVEVLLPKQTDAEKQACVIIDSKVSIKDYLAYIYAEDEKEKEQAAKNHVQSVAKHVEELASKNYEKEVSHAVGYVLMFIPHDGSYILMMDKRPGLIMEAYKKRIVIVNPTNLMMSLNIINLLWQNQRQSENVGKIFTSAQKIYEKFVTITDRFTKLGETIQASSRAFNDTCKLFCSGNGNLVRQFNQWKDLGLQTTKQINPKLLQLSEDFPGEDLPEEDGGQTLLIEE